MPTVKLPSIQVPDGTLANKVDYLTDMLVQYKKALEYYVNNLDDANVSSLTGAVIKNLGKEYSDEEALAAWIASDYATYIDSSGVYTGTLTALQVNAVNIDADSITTGTLSANRIATDISQVDDTLYIGSTTQNGVIWLRGSSFGSSDYAMVGTKDPTGTLDTGSVYIGASAYIVLEADTLVAVMGHLDVDGDLDIGGDLDVGDYVTSDLIPSSSGAYDLGSSTKRWNLYGASAYLTGYLYCNEVRDSSVTGDPVYVNTSAKLGYYSSTIKHKDNVEPYEFDLDKLLALKIVSFNYKPEFNEDQSIQYGIIAEQADELGLDMFVGKDKTGEIKSFAYHKLPIANLNALQCHENRLKAIEERLGI